MEQLRIFKTIPKKHIAVNMLFIFLNVFVGQVVEVLYFRGYFTSKLSRFGKWSPVIITVLFSLYHLWLPLQNIFRISIFLPVTYLTWDKKDIYISIVFRCL
ncbi:MAG: CPBP family intramembrane metalloprotease [Lachnospiraceae bacterium]|nr:CPBP family intramembrane metalloprotease [Lachnospiraceae bacterium]